MSGVSVEMKVLSGLRQERGEKKGGKEDRLTRLN